MPSRQGSPNKNKAFLLNRLQDMYGDDFHPIIQIAKNCVELQDAVDCIKIPAVDVDEDITHEDVVDAKLSKVSAIRNANAEWSRIAEYTEPKLKAVDVSVSGPDGGPIQTDSVFEFIPVSANNDPSQD